MWPEVFVVMDMVVCEVEQTRAYLVVVVYLVVAGGSLVIGFRGRLIPQWRCIRKLVAVVGGSLVMWASFLYPAVLGWRSLSALRLSGADQHLILHHVGLG